MSKSIKALVALSFVALVAACGGGDDVEEFVVETVTVEPTFEGKL